MKKIIAIAVMLLIAVGAYAQVSSRGFDPDGSKLYNRFSDSEGVSAVYISPTMFKLIGKIPELNVEVGDSDKLDVAPLIHSFTGFYMLDVSDRTLAGQLKSEVNFMVSSGLYDMLMEMKESGSHVRIYISGGREYINSLVFLATEDGKTQYICLEGMMKRSEVEKLISGM